VFNIEILRKMGFLFVSRESNQKEGASINIGFIGGGHIGKTLRRFSAVGHKVFVAKSRGPETLKDLAAETGATPVTINQAARGGKAVILTIPTKNIPDEPWQTN
jgi:8-hydroxy-5-deazaflavin:NADPH oxidoreductase